MDARSEEADDLLGRLELLDNVTIVPLRGIEQAARPADIIAKTGSASMSLKDNLRVSEIAHCGALPCRRQGAAASWGMVFARVGVESLEFVGVDGAQHSRRE